MVCGMFVERAILQNTLMRKYIDAQQMQMESIGKYKRQWKRSGEKFAYFCMTRPVRCLWSCFLLPFRRTSVKWKCVVSGSILIYFLFVNSIFCQTTHLLEVLYCGFTVVKLLDSLIWLSSFIKSTLGRIPNNTQLDYIVPPQTDILIYKPYQNPNSPLHINQS